MNGTEARVEEADLHAWVDGQLPEARRADVAVWLAIHPEERARSEDWAAVNRALRELYDPILEEPVPERLLSASSRRLPDWLGRVAIALVWIAVGGALGWAVRDATFSDEQASAALSRRAASAFVVYAPEVRHPVEVEAAQETHLVRWLSKRLGHDVRAPNLVESGYALVGGRLLPDEQGRPAAQFMYQNGRGDRVTLYVAADPSVNRETAFRYAEHGDVRIFYWIDGEMGFALTGRVPKDVLSGLANETYRQLNP